MRYLRKQYRKRQSDRSHHGILRLSASFDFAPLPSAQCPVPSTQCPMPRWSFWSLPADYLLLTRTQTWAKCSHCNCMNA